MHEVKSALRRAIRRPVSNGRILRAMARVERSSSVGEARPDLWLRGYYSYRIYNYPDFLQRRNEYLSDWMIERRAGSLNPVPTRQLLTDKLRFAQWLELVNLAAFAPMHLGQIINGSLTFNEETVGKFDEATAIIKPRRGSGGKGVTILNDLRDAASYRTSIPDAIIQEVVQPHPYSLEIYPRTLNTIRVLAIRINHEATKVAAAVHRFGSATSGITDNVSRGGFVASVDVESGEMSDIAQEPRSKERVTYARHPETGARVEGVAIPNWNEIRQLVERLMEALPEAIHVGWDIALTESGPVVIEGNGRPGLGLHQMHGPFVNSSVTVANFYHDHGIIGSSQWRTLSRIL